MAIRDYDEAIRLIPKGNAAAFNNRALVLVSLRQYDRAIADYDEALRLEPNNGTYLRIAVTPSGPPGNTPKPSRTSARPSPSSSTSRPGSRSRRR